jgi:hypothetical protein
MNMELAKHAGADHHAHMAADFRKPRWGRR